MGGLLEPVGAAEIGLLNLDVTTDLVGESLGDDPAAGEHRDLVGEREDDVHVVFSLADKISVLSGGRIIAEGLPDEVRANIKVQEAYLGGAHRLEAVH